MNLLKAVFWLGLGCAVAPAQEFSLGRSSFGSGEAQSSGDGFVLRSRIGPEAGGPRMAGAGFDLVPGLALVLVELPGSPRLRVQRTPEGVALSWPSGAGTFVLQTAAGLNGAAWSDVAVSPQLDGANLRVVVPVGGGTGARFFRLQSR